MPDLHTRAVSSTDQLDLRPAIRDAINGSIAKILQIQDDAGLLSPECFKRVERQTQEACMELGRRVLQEVPEDRDAQLPDAIEEDGRVFRRRKATPKTGATLLGSVTCRRARYRTREAGASLVPVDESLGLINGRPARSLSDRTAVQISSRAVRARGLLCAATPIFTLDKTGCAAMKSRRFSERGRPSSPTARWRWSVSHDPKLAGPRECETVCILDATRHLVCHPKFPSHPFCLRRRAFQ